MPHGRNTKKTGKVTESPDKYGYHVRMYDKEEKM